MGRKIIYIIHPGTQYAFQTANSLAMSAQYSEVHLFTWFLLKEGGIFSKVKFFKKRVKQIAPEIKLHIFPFFEGLLLLAIKTKKVFSNTDNFNLRYLFYLLFCWFMLPIIYINRKKIIVVLTETAAWPLTKHAMKWGIPVVMDFASISHEKAEELGIPETRLGKLIKSKERQYIDYAIYCSNFAASTYRGLTSAKKHFPVWLGAAVTSSFARILPYKQGGQLKIACLANTELRKGIDFLLKAFSQLEIGAELYLVGKISPGWVSNYCQEHQILLTNIHFTGPLPQQALKDFLLNNNIHLHILASRFDSFGMVVPETMMLGIPNIVSPNVGAGEALKNEINGFIMQELSAKSLLECIIAYLQKTDDERTAMQMDVLAQAEQISWQSYYGKIDEVFGKITELSCMS